MEMTLGKRIATLRKGKGLKQEELATALEVSSQAVSKWENDQCCPDISLLPKLAKLLGVSVDALLSGETEKSIATFVPEKERKDVKDMVLRITVDSADGDKVRINLPMGLFQILMDTGTNMFEVSGNDAMKSIDWAQVMELIRYGVMGELVSVESADGDKVHIFVE